MESSNKTECSKDILITNIQRFSLHDGPGIRTTIFFKGCALRCPWCSNPENLRLCQENYTKDGIKGTYGLYMSCEDLFGEIVKDKAFYGANIYNKKDYLSALLGGVTFSGGEALLQIEHLIPLLKRLKEEHIHTTVETSLFVEEKNLQIAMKYIDLFYVDIKILEPNACKRVIGGELSLYLKNVDLLMKQRKDTIFRVPIIGNYTDTNMNRGYSIEFIKKYKPLKVELLKEHNLGTSKYITLGLEPPVIEEVLSEYLEEYKEQIIEQGIPCEICIV